MAFSQKLINVAFTLATGQFAGGGNTANLEGLRISARIDGPGGITGQTATVAIWGMPLTMMNQLSLVGNQIYTVSPQNTIKVTAGDSPQNMQLTFSGIIRSSFMDASRQPDICFRVEGAPGGAVNVQPATAGSSSSGQLDVVQKLQTLAGLANPPLEFVNHGVSATLRNQYLYGSVNYQIYKLARAAGIEVMIDRGKLIIWKAGTGPDSGITISSPNMVGYPTFSQSYIHVPIPFNPGIQNGQIVTVQSQITAACGKWQVNNFTHEIESNIPKGKWFTIVSGAPFSAQTPSSG